MEQRRFMYWIGIRFDIYKRKKMAKSLISYFRDISITGFFRGQTFSMARIYKSFLA